MKEIDWNIKLDMTRFFSVPMGNLHNKLGKWRQFTSSHHYKISLYLSTLELNLWFYYVERTITWAVYSQDVDCVSFGSFINCFFLFSFSFLFYFKSHFYDTSDQPLSISLWFYSIPLAESENRQGYKVYHIWLIFQSISFIFFGRWS